MIPSSTRAPSNRGFTLIELTVVVGIVMILVGLLLPAVQSARESARRALCQNRLHQLAIAANNFAAARGGLPPASTDGLIIGRLGLSTFSVQVELLPYLEQQNLYNSINKNTFWGDYHSFATNHSTIARTVVATFLCPSDPQSRAQPLGPNSYRVSAGVRQFHRTAPMTSVFDDDGVFSHSPPTLLPLSAISDGFSMTLAFSEKPIGSIIEETYSPFRDWLDIYESVLDDESGFIPYCDNVSPLWPRKNDSGMTWITPGAMYTAFYALLPPNDHRPDCGQTSNYGTGLFTARSYHPGCVNAAMVDGSVHAITSGIDRAVWRALATRAGNEVVTIP